MKKFFFVSILPTIALQVSIENTGKVSMSDATSKDTKRTYADVVSMKYTKTNESNE